MSQKHVLSGIKVLDFTQYLAGPTTTRLMAEMGAEIIKVEMAPMGDPTRGIAYLRNKRSAYYIQQNRGKKSISLDMSKPESKEILLELAKQVDVVMENFSPGVIGRLGLDWETVHKINPNAIMCSLSAFGQTGPLSHLSGFDYIAQAYSGVTSMIGEPGGQAYLPMLGIGDVSTGVHALAAINGALFHRERGGGGQHLDISLLDAYFHMHEMNVQMISASGGEIQPTRSGSHHFAVAPLGLYQGKDGYIVVIALGKMWDSLCNAMGRADMIEDPKFATNDARIENKDELISIVEGWIQSQESDAVAVKLLEDARVPVAPMLSVAEAMAHPHLRERRTIREVSDRVFGTVEIPGMPLKFSQFPDDLDLDTPFLGEYNKEVIGGWLGMSDDEYQKLEDAGVLHSRPIRIAEAGE